MAHRKVPVFCPFFDDFKLQKDIDCALYAADNIAITATDGRSA